jgi:hypothetical protein
MDKDLAEKAKLIRKRELDEIKKQFMSGEKPIFKDEEKPPKKYGTGGYGKR